MLYWSCVNNRNSGEFNETQFLLRRRLLDRNCKFNGTEEILILMNLNGSVTL